MFILTNISTVLFITTAVNLVVTYISWRRQDAPVGRYFAWAMLSVTFWTLNSGLDYSATTIPLKTFFAKLEYISYHCSLTLFLMFSMAYAGYQERLRKLPLQLILWFIPLVNSILVLTNQFHELIWTGFAFNPNMNNVLVFQHGPAFLWVVTTNYFYILSIFFFLLHALRNFSEFTRRQARLLLGATAFPIITNLFYLFEIIPTTQGVDWTAATFSVSGLLILIALYGTQLLDIVPIAHHLLVERMPDCILVLDHNNHVVDFNPAMQEKFGINKNHLGQKVEKVMIDWPGVIKLTLLDETPPPLEVMVDTPTLSVFDTRLTRLVDERNQLYGKLIVFRNVTVRYKTRQALQEQLVEVQELNKKISYLAERDSLTNAYTRRYLYEKLSEWIHHKTPFIVALLDIDKFKQINDAHGHTIGDEVLIGLTKELFAIAGEDDIVCRYGGEEFVVVMQNISIDEIFLKFEQVLKEFHSFCFTTFGIQSTISIGLADYPADSQTLDEILNLADKTMYQAKSAGGNQIMVYSKE